MRNLYLVLGVSVVASPAELKAAYLKRAQTAHPDKGGTPAEFSELKSAYEILSNPEKRASYKRDRAEWLADRRAVECPECGEANRIKRLKKGLAPHCGHCETQLPIVVAAPSPLVQRVTDLAEDIGERVTDEAGELVRDGVDRVFETFRNKLGLNRRRRAVHGR